MLFKKLTPETANSISIYYDGEGTHESSST